MIWLSALLKLFMATNPWVAVLLVVVCDVPRDTLSFVLTALDRLVRRREQVRLVTAAEITVVIPVLDNAGGLLAALHALRRQTVPPRQVIVVDDGSADATAAVLAHARAAGLVDLAISNPRRMGVAGACNKALRFVSSDRVLFLDCDTELAPTALAELATRMHQTGAAAVSGNIAIRNERASLWTAIQQVEYMIAIDFGRSFLDRFNAIACCSGAMTMFDTAALRAINGFNAGSGQDLDVTLRLREAGRRITFAARAWAFTDGPETLAALVRQRLRWERDALRIHLIQHRQLRQFGSRESLGNTIQRYDFINFTFFPTFLLPVLLIGVATMDRAQLPAFLLAGYLLMLAMAGLNLAVIFAAYRGAVRPFHLLLLPIFPLYQGIVMKAVRLYAFVSETVWRASRRDGFVPARVRRELYKDPR